MWVSSGTGNYSHRRDGGLCLGEDRLVNEIDLDIGTCGSAVEEQLPAEEKRTLVLEVPWQNPMQALLCADDHHLVTHYFVWPLDSDKHFQVASSTIVLQLWQ